MNYTLALFGGLVFFVILSIFSSRNQNYFLGKKKYGTFATTTGILASFIGGSITLNLINLSNTYGWYAFFDLIPTSTALILLSFYITKDRSVKFFEGIKYRSIIGERTHHGMIFLLYFLVIVSQIVALRTLEPFIDINIDYAIMLILLLIWLYSFKGYSMVVKTDQIQFILMFLFLYGILAVKGLISISTDIFDVNMQDKIAMPIPLILSLGLFFIFVPVSQEVHQRVIASESTKIVKKSFLFAGILYIVLGGIIVTTTIFFNLDGFQGMLQFVGHPMVSTLLFLAISVALMSTIDTSINLVTHSFDKLSGPNLHHNYYPLISLSVLILGIITSMYFPTILSVILLAIYIYISAPAYLTISNLIKIPETTSAIISTVAIIGHILIKVFSVSNSLEYSLTIIITQASFLCVKAYRREQ